MTTISLADIQAMDAADPIATKRQAFCLPQDRIYLDGNSLGAMPIAAKSAVQQVLEQEWSQDLISSWNKHAWIDLPQVVGDKIGNLIGADSGQVICADSISVNLFKLLAGALKLQAGRKQILSTKDNFPTDLYMVQGIQQWLGKQHCELVLCEQSQIAEYITEQTAVVLLTHVNFRTGAILNMQGITQRAHQHGTLVIWDLAHSVGALPLSLDKSDVDFAVGCGYKYLNGGPGAPAFAYVNKRILHTFQQPLSGWMGHQNPFEFNPIFNPAKDINKMLCGTPPILSMQALDAALGIFADVNVRSLYEKSMSLTSLFHQLLCENGLDTRLRLISPSQASKRGSQLAYRHPHAYGICQALIETGVVGDFRAPNILRLGFAPLYNSYLDIWRAVEKLAAVMQSKAYLDIRWQSKNAVT